MKYIFLSALFFFVKAGSNPSQEVQPSKSKISFSISNMIVNTVEGSFTDFSGEVFFDINKMENSRFQIKIPVASIDTDNEERDKHLMAEDYFYKDKFPYAVFTSSFVNKTAEGFDITGKLSVRGESKTITIPFSYTKTSDGYLLKGEYEIDRYDFKIGDKGSFLMGRDVDLEIQCYIVEKQN
tara:strand:- start:288 stop:833 length:546 start_codon:yes stop_codon:yes gene_type:complete